MLPIDCLIDLNLSFNWHTLSLWGLKIQQCLEIVFWVCDSLVNAAKCTLKLYMWAASVDVA